MPVDYGNLRVIESYRHNQVTDIEFIPDILKSYSKNR